MMLTPVTDFTQIPAFADACAYEHVFGSRALTALHAYGLGDARARFYLCKEGEMPTAALYLSNGVLCISAHPNAQAAPIAQLIEEQRVTEVDSNFAQCKQLQDLLGGTVESSYYMVYRGSELAGEYPGMAPGNLRDAFDILQRSHEYYRTHLQYDIWAEDLERRLSRGLAELYQLERDGKPVGTGSIISGDDTCGVIGAVAVVPEYRHRDLGGLISRFLTKRILQKGKTPRLISGYDEVAELYRQVGFETCGRWGELYLTDEKISEEQ